MARYAGRLAILALLLSLAIPLSPAAAQQSKTTSFGVKGILLLPGEAYVEEADAYFDIDMSFGIGGLVDTKLGEKFWGGVFLDILSVSAADESATMFEFGVSMKAALGGENGKPTWRPGLGIGYANLSDAGGVASTTYLTIRGGVEAVLSSGWVAEAIIYGAPTGGNDDFTVTYGPLFQLRFGRIF
jgi:hypothetical protein